MLKAILGVVTGVVVFLIVVTIAGPILRLTWPAYVSAAPTFHFTLPMLLTRLSIGAVATIAAGLVAALVARRSTRVALATGVVLLVGFLPEHIMIWAKFPVWYHLTFLLSLLPLTWLGGVGSAAQRSKARRG
jgi:Mn2+/Fe2+ NRAMP family transporter